MRTAGLNRIPFPGQCWTSLGNSLPIASAERSDAQEAEWGLSFVMAGLVAQVGFTRLVPHHLIRKSGRPDLRCHPRLWCCNAAKTWMPGIKPGMTGERFVAG